ncbi:hypothetical protein PIB30_043969 [Stylosanthes scabra]|uniref:Uncharacterized protein n=1 Tax=Stylosanthes scabra TaxID=79078 RepID=A0ABU6RFS0_9FABA|nr:hypothetical protein [Stylosanthes scabra]
MEGRRFSIVRNPPLPTNTPTGTGDSAQGAEREGLNEVAEQLPPRGDTVLEMFSDIRAYLERSEETT